MEFEEQATLRTIRGKPLVGKVALIIDGATRDGRSLALSLARYGADIAIVHLQEHAADAHETRKLVEAHGRRCLIIPALIRDKVFSLDVVQRTVTTLGRLDFFIDYSYVSAGDVGSNGSPDAFKKRERNDPFEFVELMSAALQHMGII